MARYLVVCALLVIAALPCAAMPGEDPFALDVILRLLGADVGVGYRGLQLLPSADTTFWAYAGGGYEWPTYYRDPSDALIGPGGLEAGQPLASYDPTFTRIEAAWRLGMAQGFAWNARTKTNLVEAFLFYRGRIDSNQVAGSILSLASLPDRDGMLLNVLQTGLAYNDILTSVRSKARDGFSAELSAEWAPSFFFNTVLGNADYIRFNGTLWYFLPLFDLAPAKAMNVVSIYFGEYFSADYIQPLSAAPIPIYIRQTFGGRSQVTGLGSTVRGVDTGSLDTNLKAVNSVELRVNLPALFTRDLVPGVAAFWDIGYYDQLGEPSVAAAIPSGFVTSVGAGVYIDVFDLGYVAAYGAYRLDNVNANGSPWSFPIEFGLHF